MQKRTIENKRKHPKKAKMPDRRAEKEGRCKRVTHLKKAKSPKEKSQRGNAAYGPVWIGVGGVEGADGRAAGADPWQRCTAGMCCPLARNDLLTDCFTQIEEVGITNIIKAPKRSGDAVALRLARRKRRRVRRARMLKTKLPGRRQTHARCMWAM